MAEHEAGLDGVALDPQGLGEPIEPQRHAGHGVAEQHAEQRDGVLGRVPRRGPENDHQGQDRDREGRQEHGRHADADAPRAGQSAFLARGALVARYDQHHQRDDADPGEIDAVEHHLQNQADQQQLHHHARAGDEKARRETKPEGKRQRRRAEHEERGQRQLQGAEKNHRGASPIGSVSGACTSRPPSSRRRRSATRRICCGSWLTHRTAAPSLRR